MLDAVACCAAELAFQCRVAVLDGGLQAWQAKGYPLDTQIASEADVDAAAHAANQAPSSPPKYPAKLQVGMRTSTACLSSISTAVGAAPESAGARALRSELTTLTGA